MRFVHSRKSLCAHRISRLPCARAGSMEPSSVSEAGEQLWIQEHPRFKEMVSMDISDSSQVYCAFLVYIDLIEVRNWHDVQIMGSTELDLVYLFGQEKAGQIPQVIIPTPVTISCSHKRMQQYMKLGSAAEDGIGSSVLLAIMESDSTIVYYKLTEGFVIPDPPNFAEEITNKRGRKRKMKMPR